ncbi:FliM/FliN family flagellar motor switch protein [Rhodobacteraceae bacterium M385]|nr:FliM/FliN family flagellar motor switch protein [Rhodobacteraceae bacterium M385]
MSATDTQSVLSRMIAAHLGLGAGKGDIVPGLQTGLTRAIRRSAMPYGTLAPEVAEVSVTSDATLSESVAGLPEHGLLAAIEDDSGRRGLFALDHPLVDALIEVQATGHVEEVLQPPRTITRIDEALCRDFVDLVLGAFALETATQPDRDWPDRMNYGSSIAERAQLNLLMPERGYHLLKVSVTMGGHKTGELAILMPSDPAIARRNALAAPQGDVPEQWGDKMLGALRTAPMALDAVLMRVTMSLGKVEALKEGDLIPFEFSDLAAVTLENESGHVVASGGLGQLSGRRAVRLGGATPGVAPDAGTGATADAGPAKHASLPASGLADYPMAQADAGVGVPLDEMPMAAVPDIAVSPAMVPGGLNMAAGTGGMPSGLDGPDPAAAISKPDPSTAVG